MATPDKRPGSMPSFDAPDSLESVIGDAASSATSLEEADGESAKTFTGAEETKFPEDNDANEG